jgi:NADH-quinone oxidoreductase subunit A
MTDLSQYLPILLFLVVALALSSAFVFLPMGVSRLTGTHKPTEAKLTEYECGFPAFEDSRSQFDVRFYLVAILFIIFDLEAAFLFPWSCSGWIVCLRGVGGDRRQIPLLKRHQGRPWPFQCQSSARPWR